MSSTPPNTPHDEDALRPHTYDGIQEFDKRLPNWWLHTLYWAIAFSFVYWFVHFNGTFIRSDQQRVEDEMKAIETLRLAQAPEMDDATLWLMSRNADMVALGRTAYETHCIACHGPALEGGIGFNLVDATWVHGGRPTEIAHTITVGVDGKGMQAWGPTLGPRVIGQVTAYVLSHHDRTADDTAVPLAN